MIEKKQILPRFLLGGIIGGIVLFLIGAVLNGFMDDHFIATGGSWFIPISTSLTKRIGSPCAALAVEVILYFMLGALVGGATLPFANDGKHLALLTAGHGVTTFAVVSLLIWLCGWDVGRVDYWLTLLGIFVFMYLFIWVGRWIGWYMEINTIREKLGLKRKKSFMNWIETLPYLLFILIVVFLLLLIGSRERTGVFLLLFVPWLIMPFIGFWLGLSLGRRFGFCPLYPLFCPVLYFLEFQLVKRIGGLRVAQDWWLFLLPGVFALIGNIIGCLPRDHKPEDPSPEPKG